MKRFRRSLPSKQWLSRLWDWRVPVLLMVLGGAYLFGPPLWDAISVSPQQRVEPLKQRIAELDQRIKASPTPSTTDLKEIATLEKGRIDSEHAIRTTAVQAIAGLFVIVTAWIAWKNLQSTNEKQIAERFSKAIEQLGNENIHVRLGGIYALEQITKDDEERYYWQVLETLTSYVRERSPWPPKTPTKHSSLAESVITATESSNEDIIPPLPTDIQAVMTVLARRKHTFGHRLEPHRLDLRKVDLGSLQLPLDSDLGEVNLTEANMRGAMLRGVKLQGAILRKVNLQKAVLIEASLQRASLRGANLQMAQLREVNLQRASLREANLQKANLWRANLYQSDLVAANLQEANLSTVNLQKAKLWQANLHEALFSQANLQGTRFKQLDLGLGEAVELTWEQINMAASYTKELLPDYLLEQRRTASGEEGKEKE